MVEKDGSKVEVKPVTPEAMLVIYLDEISGRLSDIQEVLEVERSKGEIRRRDISVAGGAPIEYDIRRDEATSFFVADIYNDGPNTVYVSVDRHIGNEIVIRDDEGIRIDRTKAQNKLRWLYFRCADGERASIRVIGQW